MPTKSSAQQANELLATGAFRSDGRILQLMLEYQMQLMEILEDCTSQSSPGDDERQQERFMNEVYHASEAFNMLTLAMVHTYTEGHTECTNVKRMFASILQAGLQSAILESMADSVKTPNDLMQLFRQIKDRANAFHLKQVSRR